MIKYHVFLANVDVRHITPWQVLDVAGEHSKVFKKVLLNGDCHTFFDEKRNRYVIEIIGDLSEQNDREAFITNY